MNRWFLSAICCLLLTAPAFGARGPKIDLIDNKLSIDADTIPLARLLKLLDFATGMKSKVPPELANRNISVKFSGLSVIDGVQKIFQGQRLDYVVIEGQGVIVTAASQTLNGTETVPTYAAGPEPAYQDFQQPQGVQPGNPGQPGFPGQPQQQPATVQTPFGAMPNARAGTQPNSPLSAPGQNSLFPNSLPSTQPTTGFSNQPTSIAPMGTITPFGTAPQNNPGNVFGGAPNLFPGSQPPHQ